MDIDAYRKGLISTFSEEERLSLAPAVVDRLGKDSNFGESANFAFGIHAFATLVVPALNARSSYKWFACFELSDRLDALVNRSPDMNGSDGLLVDRSGQKFRYAARVRRATSVPECRGAGTWGLNVRLAYRKEGHRSSVSEYAKLDKRAEHSMQDNDLPWRSSKDRPPTEYPAFQITAIVEKENNKLVGLRMASAKDVVAAVTAGLRREGELALLQALECRCLSDEGLAAIRASCEPGLQIQEIHDAVFLWIADYLVPKYRIGPSDELASNTPHDGDMPTR